MNSRVERKTVDLSPFPDLVVIYLSELAYQVTERELVVTSS